MSRPGRAGWAGAGNEGCMNNISGNDRTMIIGGCYYRDGGCAEVGGDYHALTNGSLLIVIND